MHRFRICFLLLSVGWYAHAQVVSMNKSETKLHSLFNRLYSATNDLQRQAVNDSICNQFTQTFSQPASFDYPFDSLQYIGKIYSVDHALRIYSWNYIIQSGEYYFVCFIQRKQDDAVFRLTQSKSVYLPQNNGSILVNNWYGALYYNAIPYSYHKKTVYLLLGWSRYTESLNFKIIDVLSFEDHQIQLGEPLFQDSGIAMSRVIIPYSSRYALTLQYDAKNRMIFFNHLSHSSGNNKSIMETKAIPDENFSAYLITKTGLKYKDELPLKDEQLPHASSHFKAPDSVE
jgi:hypothetical protein